MAAYPQYMSTLSIDEFFTVIKDGAWHSIDEVSDQVGLQTSKLTKLSKLLSEHGLIKYEEKNHRIKIEPSWKLLLQEEEPTEPKTTLASFIIPPKTSIDVQSTHISNIGNIELEVSLRIDSKIKEVAIKT